MAEMGLDLDEVDRKYEQLQYEKKHPEKKKKAA